MPKSRLVALAIAMGLVACSGPVATQPPPAVEPSPVPPTATPWTEPTEAPTAVPTAPPTDVPTEAPATEEPPGVEPTKEQPTMTGGETLLEERCTVCHGADRVTRARKTREAWEQTVRRMIGLGAELDEQETTVLVDYLAEIYGQ